MMGFNFTNFNWNTSPTLPAPLGQYDLYSVVLHEATHILGFASMINYNGDSRFGTLKKYFTRYDLFLKTQQNIPLINQISPICGSMYNYNYNPALNQSPSVMNYSGCSQPSIGNTNTSQPCASAVKYQSTFSQIVYTPGCYEAGSSLSHFEDECQVPVGSPSNDGYFVMSNANGTGPSFTKRFLKPIERNVLCDIGYRVNTNFGGTYQAIYNYGESACSGLGIVGINDGITSNGAYQWTVNQNSPIIISPLTNDYSYNGVPQGSPSNLSVDCPQVVFGTGTVSAITSSGFTYTPTQAGLHLLRYVPKNTSGNSGNITYIYVWCNSSTCLSNTCNLVNNGGLETTTVACLSSITSEVNCWATYSSSPDLFGPNCQYPTYQIPTTAGFFPAGTEPHDLLSSGNNHFSGLWASSDYDAVLDRPTNFDIESAQSLLSSPLIHGQSYKIEFWARRNNQGNSAVPARIVFYGSPNTISAVSNPFNLPSNTVELYAVDVPNNNQWNFYSSNFTYNSTANSAALIRLIVANDIRNQSYSIVNRYTLIDDISILPLTVAPTISLPSNDICVLSTVAIDVFPPNGTVTGPGVSQIASGWSFNAAIAGLGNHTLSYSITNANGCIYQTSFIVHVQAENCICECPSGMPEFPIPAGTTQTSSLGTSTITGRCLKITQDLEVNSDFALYGCNVVVSPGVRISVTNSTFRINNTIVRGCDAMWKGIVNSSKLFIENGSIVRDAEVALTMKRGSGGSEINSSTLTNNFIGISHTSENTGGHILSLKVALIQGGALLADYSGQTPATLHNSLAGIRLYNGFILNPIGAGNRFIGLNNGILTNNATLTVNGAIFENIRPHASYSGSAYYLDNYNGNGIYASNNSRVVVTGMTTLPGANDPKMFISCARGIVVDNSSLSVSGCHFSDASTTQYTQHGIIVRYLNQGRVLSLRNNRIKSSMEGIRIFGCNYLLDGLVQNCNITQTNTNFGYATAGIWLSNQTNAATLIIERNEISMNNGTSSSAGIYLIGAGGIKVRANVIALGSSCPGRGIYIAQSSNSILSCNLISGTNASSSAIEQSSSASNALLSNSTNGTSRGFYFTNTNTLTNFSCNMIGSHSVGLDVTGSIGNQYNKMNQWLGTFATIGARRTSFASGDLFTTHTTNPLYYPTHNPTNFFTQLNITAGICKSCGTAGNTFSALTPTNSEAGLDLATKIANDSLYFPDYINEFTFYSRRDLESMLRSGELILPDTGIYEALKINLAESREAEFNKVDEHLNVAKPDSTFKELIKSYTDELIYISKELDVLDSTMATAGSYTNIELEFQRENLLNQMNFKKQQIVLASAGAIEKQGWDRDSAFVYNNGIVTQENFEQYEKAVNEIFLATMAKNIYEYSTAQEATLQFIANLCPALGGSAVYKARSLYYLINDTASYNDANLCIQQGVLFRIAQETNSSSVSSTIKIYPNPTKESFTIECPFIENQSVRYTILSSIGQVVLSGRILSTVQIIEVVPDQIAAGIYLIKLTDQDGTVLKMEKLIIRK